MWQDETVLSGVPARPYGRPESVLMIAGLNDMTSGTILLPDVARRPTVSATYVRGVLEFAVSRGVSSRPLLADAGIADADLTVDEMRLPLDCLIALMRAAATRCDDPAFALHFGDYVPCDQISLAAPMGQAASTVRDAMEQVNRYARLGIDFPALGDGDRYRIDIDAIGAWVVDLRPRDAWPEITESVFARMARGARRIAQRDVLRAVHVTHAAPAHAAEYETIFRVPVFFQSTRNALVFEPAYMNTPLTPAPAHVTRIIAAHADAQVSSLEQQRTCRGRVDAALRSLLESGDVSMDRVARTLAMSRQTLYRKLKAEGVTFERVLDELRHVAAVELMRTGKVAVRDASRRLGFSDPAAFSRAFKRWTGRSPGTRASS
jgi:AraC-like DNA-binding protein